MAQIGWLEPAAKAHSADALGRQLLVGSCGNLLGFHQIDERGAVESTEGVSKIS